MKQLTADQRAKLRDLRKEVAAIEDPIWEAQRKARKAARQGRQKAMRGAPKEQRQVRETEPGYLAHIRRLPCEAAHLGNCQGRIEAAHIRYSDARHGSINPGLQRKNHDRFANPLCAFHHRSDQHQRKERSFWDALGKNAYETAAAHHAAFLSGAQATPSAAIRQPSQLHEQMTDNKGSEQ